MDYVNGEQQPIATQPQQQQSQDMKDLKVVGFYVNKEVYNEYLKMAMELYQQRVPDGNGRSVPVIERPDPNLFLNFCVGFYKQYRGILSGITQSPAASKVIEQMAETLQKSGIMSG